MMQTPNITDIRPNVVGWNWVSFHSLHCWPKSEMLLPDAFCEHIQSGPKNKPDNFCNNFVYCQPIFIIFGICSYVHHKKGATRGYIVSPSNVLCVTALPWKILITTLPICLYMFTTINHNKYEKNLYFGCHWCHELLETLVTSSAAIATITQPQGRTRHMKITSNIHQQWLL